MSKLSHCCLMRIYVGHRKSAVSICDLVMIQAFIDDSKRDLGRKTLFMAGYINSPERWGDFSSGWEAALREDPPIEYFKAAEANGVRGQFRGWRRLDRELKVKKLAEVIRRTDPISFHVSVDLKSFDKAFKKNGVPWGFREPYWLAFETVIGKVPEIAKARALQGPVDFVFDKQNQIHRAVNSLWPAVKESQPEETKSFLADIPIFQDDKDILPLQAADMLAWHAQREFRSGVLDPKMHVTEKIIRSGHHFAVDFDRPTLQKLGKTLHAIDKFAEIDSKNKWRQVMDVLDAEWGKI